MATIVPESVVMGTLLTKDYHYQTRKLSPRVILTTASPCFWNLMVPVEDEAGAVFLLEQKGETYAV